jgi:predicted ribosomally synthesized peptide with nif11-like leader
VSTEAATAFIERVEADGAFAAELEGLTTDPTAVMARVRAEGLDVTADEVRDAFLARCGDQLSAEQLEAIAAGSEMSPNELAVMVSGAAAAAIGGATAIAAAAAF